MRVPIVLRVLFPATLAACASSPPPPAAQPAPAPAPSPPVTTAATPPAPAAQAPAPSPSDQDEFAKVQEKVEKVGGNVYVLYGEGGNIGVSVGDDGIVIVDDQFAPLADKIKAALAGITNKPLRFVLNTHWHGDHTGGNAIFGRAAPIVAQENVRKRLANGDPEHMRHNEKVPAKPPAPPEALPVVTFADAVSVHLNGEEIRMIHEEHAHTDGDSVVLFTKSNVVHMGDLYFGKTFPFVDHRAGGSVKGLIAALNKLLKELPADVRVIPGHGQVSGLDGVRSYLAVIDETYNLVQAAVKKKQTLAQMQKANLLAKYASFASEFVSVDEWLKTLYEEISKPEPSAPKTAH